MIRNVHEQFIEAVMEGRKMSRAEVEKIADGRIFTGRQAKELGLVDDLGSFEDDRGLNQKNGRSPRGNQTDLSGDEALFLLGPYLRPLSRGNAPTGPGDYPALQFLWLAPYGSSPS